MDGSTDGVGTSVDGITPSLPEALPRLLGSHSRAAILELFFDRPGEPMGVREVARRAGGLDYKSAWRELRNLRELGVLRDAHDARQGQARRFEVDPSFPALPEMRGLVTKLGRLGCVRQLREAVLDPPWIRAAAAFGSIVGGTANERSDVDLLVVAEGDDARFIPIADRLRVGLGRKLDFLLYTPEEFDAMRRSGRGLIPILLQSEMVILKGADLLER